MSEPDPPGFEELKHGESTSPHVMRDHLHEPSFPRFIPIARPALPSGVVVVSPASMRAGLPRLSAGRSFLELAALVPMAIAGIVMFEISARILGVRDERWANVASTLGMGIAASLTSAFFVWLDRQPAASIGWTGRAFIRQINVGILTLIGTYASFMILVIFVTLLFPELQDAEPTAQRAIREMMPDMPMRWMIALMLFVALWEEVVFRGFVLTRLHAIVGRWWLAVPLSALIFGSVHIYEGPVAMVVVTLLGVVLALVFIRRRSLVPCIVMHFLHNSFMLFMMHRHWFDPVATG